MTYMKFADSSCVEFAKYDEETKELFITFTSGETYVYKNVQANTVEDFFSAASAGEYFNSEIKSWHHFYRVD